MNSIIIAALISWLTTLLLIRYNHLHESFTADSESGVQKFHAHPTPRVGGVGLYLGLIGVDLWLLYKNPAIGRPMLLLMLAALPAFAGGLAEDLTKRVSVSWRLMLTMLSAALGYWLLDAGLNRLDIPVIDAMLTWWPLSLLLTLVAIAGVANAVNIIDGFNGLAGVVCLMIFGALGYVAFMLGDAFLWMTCAALIGGLFGFLIWNYPRGLIFLGDGGAYFLGFMAGELAVLLVLRHPEVSPWFPLLLMIYPIFETLFSIYRRRFLRGVSPGLPDGIHLHTLIYKRLVRWAVGSAEANVRTQRNALTAPYLWLLSSLAVFPAMLFWRSTPILIGFTLAFAVLYVWLYRRIVLFRAPRKLVLRKDK
ncbi:MAG: glycosyltransferase [Zoogloeaceae bacterium]|jgi:UDP-N-acetylmuramyl pentapeptide phosphotransferase/UDP-N-acetylglucosamine-1-phosphate transferase|nr:glycosyltransferase [Zoogloeaceae bacterium]